MQKSVLALATTTLLVGTLAAPAVAQMLGPSGIPVIIDHGQEPRQLLRYQWSEGQTETARMTMGVEMAMSMNGMSMMDLEMPMEMEMDYTVVEVMPDGTARFDLVWTAFDFGELGLSFDAEAMGEEAVDMNEVNDAVADELSGVTRDFVGITGWQVVDTRGAVLDFGIDMPEAFPAEMRQQFDSVSNSVQMLPDEPVGQGARWTAAASLDASGMPMEMESVYEIVALDEDGVTIEITFEPDGDFAAAMRRDFLGEMPPEVDLELERFEFDGGGQTRIDFAHLTPTGDVGMGFAVEASVSAPEDELPMTVGMGVELDIGMSIERVE
jgi:hypothetical protein